MCDNLDTLSEKQWRETIKFLQEHDIPLENLYLFLKPEHSSNYTYKNTPTHIIEFLQEHEIPLENLYLFLKSEHDFSCRCLTDPEQFRINIRKRKNDETKNQKGAVVITRKMRGGKWSRKYKKGINCRKPRGFSQKQYCKYGRRRRNKTKRQK